MDRLIEAVEENEEDDGEDVVDVSYKIFIHDIRRMGAALTECE